MNKDEIIERRVYTNPQITYIKLDNDISLALESTPPEGPNEGISSIEHSLHNNPYNNIG